MLLALIFNAYLSLRLEQMGVDLADFVPPPCLYIVHEIKGVTVQYLRGYVDKQSLPPIRMNSLKTNIYLYTFNGKLIPRKKDYHVLHRS